MLLSILLTSVILSLSSHYNFTHLPHSPRHSRTYMEIFFPNLLLSYEILILEKYAVYLFRYCGPLEGHKPLQ